MNSATGNTLKGVGDWIKPQAVITRSGKLTPADKAAADNENSFASIIQGVLNPQTLPAYSVRLPGLPLAAPGKGKAEKETAVEEPAADNQPEATLHTSDTDVVQPGIKLAARPVLGKLVTPQLPVLPKVQVSAVEPKALEPAVEPTLYAPVTEAKPSAAPKTAKVNPAPLMQGVSKPVLQPASPNLAAANTKVAAADTGITEQKTITTETPEQAPVVAAEENETPVQAAKEPDFTPKTASELARNVVRQMPVPQDFTPLTTPEEVPHADVPKPVLQSRLKQPSADVQTSHERVVAKDAQSPGIDIDSKLQTAEPTFLPSPIPVDSKPLNTDLPKPATDQVPDRKPAASMPVPARMTIVPPSPAMPIAVTTTAATPISSTRNAAATPQSDVPVVATPEAPKFTIDPPLSEGPVQVKRSAERPVAPAPPTKRPVADKNAVSIPVQDTPLPATVLANDPAPQAPVANQPETNAANVYKAIGNKPLGDKPASPKSVEGTAPPAEVVVPPVPVPIAQALPVTATDVTPVATSEKPAKATGKSLPIQTAAPKTPLPSVPLPISSPVAAPVDPHVNETPATTVDTITIPQAPAQQEPTAFAFDLQNTSEQRAASAPLDHVMDVRMKEQLQAQTVATAPVAAQPTTPHFTLKTAPAVTEIAAGEKATAAPAVDTPLPAQHVASSPAAPTVIAQPSDSPTYSAAPTQHDSPVLPHAVTPQPERPEQAQPLRAFSLEFTPEGAKDVRLHVSQQSGDVHVSLHSNDAALTNKLHEGVQDLIGHLSNSGYEADAWTSQDANRRQQQRDPEAEKRRQPGSKDGDDFEQMFPTEKDNL